MLRHIQVGNRLKVWRFHAEGANPPDVSVDMLSVWPVGLNGHDVEPVFRAEPYEGRNRSIRREGGSGSFTTACLSPAFLGAVAAMVLRGRAVVRFSLGGPACCLCGWPDKVFQQTGQRPRGDVTNQIAHALSEVDAESGGKKIAETR